MSTAADPALEGAAWDLEPLVEGRGREGVEELLNAARERAAAFAERYKGRLGELDPEGLAEAMRELAEIHDVGGRAASYAMLDFTLDTTDPARGALVQKARELGAAIETQLLFFELEWNKLPDEHAETLLESDELAFCRHHLRMLRRYRPHQLSEPEERVVTELDVTGSSAFRRLFTEQVSSLDVALPDLEERASLEEALSRLQHPDRSIRESAAHAITEGLRPDVRTRAYVFNTLLADKATKDRLRDYPHWLASRNLSNEASDESVEALIEAVAGRYELARRWYRLKARLLGLDRLAYWDRMAPVSDTEERIPYDEAREIVLDCYTGFSPELGAAAGAFFENGYIDGPPRPGKRGGAFCSYTVPSRHPYVMLNYTSRPYDVLVMAHELGHGVHASLARPQGIFQFTTPLTMAETASIFGETIVLERLLERAPGANERLSLLAGSLDASVAAIFRQVAMNRFEHAMHTARREQGELSTDRFAELWLGTQAERRPSAPRRPVARRPSVPRRPARPNDRLGRGADSAPGRRGRAHPPPRRRRAALRGTVRARGVPALLGRAVVERGGARARRVAPRAARGSGARAGLRPGAAEHRRRPGRWSGAGDRLVARGGPGDRGERASQRSRDRDGGGGVGRAGADRGARAVALGARVGRPVRAAQRGPAAGAAAAPGGPERRGADRGPTPDAGGALPRPGARAVGTAQQHEPARRARSDPPSEAAPARLIPQPTTAPAARPRQAVGSSASVRYSSRAAASPRLRLSSRKLSLGAWKASSGSANPLTTAGMPRSASTASSGSVPPSRTSAGRVPQARSMAPAASCRAGWAGSNSAGSARSISIETSAPSGAAARSSRSSSAPISSARC